MNGIKMKQTAIITQTKPTRKLLAGIKHINSMRTLVFIVLLSGMSFVCPAQTEKEINIKSSDKGCMTNPEEPSYPGGPSAMNTFINQNLRDSLIQPGTMGRIFMKITIDTTGSIKVEVIHGINDVLDKEMLRVFSLMPKWIPAEKDGVKVEKTIAVPIRIGSNPEKK